MLLSTREPFHPVTTSFASSPASLVGIDIADHHTKETPTIDVDDLCLRCYFRCRGRLGKERHDGNH